MLANVRTLLRQQQAPERPRKILFFRGWRIDLDANELFDSEGVLITLTDGEFAVLRAFIERAAPSAEPR